MTSTEEIIKPFHQEKPTKKINGHPPFVYFLAVISAFSGFLFGYDTGVVSGAMILIRPYFHLDNLWVQLVVSATVAAAWLSAFLAGPVVDHIGRKTTISVGSVIFAVGSIVMGLSNTKIILCIGRILVGVAIGLTSSVVPMYLSEVSPANIRGQLVTLNTCFITFGQVTASVVDGLFSKDEINGWRYMLGIAAVPAFIQLVGLFFLPESPRWLADKGQLGLAQQALRRVRGSEDEVAREMEDFKRFRNDGKHRRSPLGIVIEVLSHSYLRRALLVGCALQIFQQIAGINTVMYYSATILQIAGVGAGDKSKIIWLSVIPASVNFIFSLLGIFLVEKLGRRRLTLFSLVGVILSLVILSGSFSLISQNSPQVNTPIDGNNSTFRTCWECIRHPAYGFCYHGSQGSCEKIADKTANRSLAGHCSKPSSGFTLATDWCPTDYGYLSLAGLIFYLMVFAVGMGTTPWTINSEIYPQWSRATCSSLATSCNWFFNFGISMTFLYLIQIFTVPGAFGFYAGLTFIGLVIFFFFLPETRGISLERVEALFQSFWWQRAPKSSDFPDISESLHL